MSGHADIRLVFTHDHLFLIVDQFQHKVGWVLLWLHVFQNKDRGLASHRGDRKRGRDAFAERFFCFARDFEPILLRVTTAGTLVFDFEVKRRELGDGQSAGTNFAARAEREHAAIRHSLPLNGIEQVMLADQPQAHRF